MRRFTAGMLLAAALTPCLSPRSFAQCDAWELAATGGPSPRQNHDLVYEGEFFLLFGGQAGGVDNNETWMWITGSWSRRGSAETPSPRSAHKMAYSGSDSAILFGGSSGGALNDTWEWKGNWRQLSPATSPPARFNHDMAYDGARDNIVMFGGYGDQRYGDTWIFADGEWTQVFPATSPPARNGHAMAYDPNREVVVLFGGYNGARLADTWEWDGETWTQVAASGPLGRQYLAMDFQGDRGTIVLACGQTGSGTLDRADDTWEFDGTEWRALEPDQIGARDQHAMAWNPDSRQLMVHGGYGGSIAGGGTGVLEDTWILSCHAPCRPDCDESTELDFFDLLCFQRAHVDPANPYGDFNGDGVRDFFDFIAFQEAYSAGCP